MYQEDPDHNPSESVSQQPSFETPYTIPVITPREIVSFPPSTNFEDDQPYQDAAELFQFLWEQLVCSSFHYSTIVLFHFHRLIAFPGAPP